VWRGLLKPAFSKIVRQYLRYVPVVAEKRDTTRGELADTNKAIKEVVDVIEQGAYHRALSDPTDRVGSPAGRSLSRLLSVSCP
jgi:hypothetical protein